MQGRKKDNESQTYVSLNVLSIDPLRTVICSLDVIPSASTLAIIIIAVKATNCVFVIMFRLDSSTFSLGAESCHSAVEE